MLYKLNLVIVEVAPRALSLSLYIYTTALLLEVVILF